MPWQLIYTSAPRGLLSGQSGFCTVARNADLREALVQRLEQISSYHYLRVAEAATAHRNPTVSAFRLLDLRGAKYYVLTRIQPCGLDFTARTNHLAHHLIFQPDELSKLPSPAAILRHWPGWMSSWQGEPRVLEDVDTTSFAAAATYSLPARTWARLTGDGGRAAGLLESECVRGCYLLCPPGSEEDVLGMYCETLQLLNFNGQFPLRPWRHTFTAFLQAEDNPNDFQWRGCQENTPAYKQALTRQAPMIALRSVRVPGNSLVKLAREDPKSPPPSPPAAKSEPSAPAAKTALKTLPHDPAKRSLFSPPPMMSSVKTKTAPSAERPPFLHRALVVNPATLAGLGIFAVVVVTLLVVKLHWAAPPAQQDNPAPPVPNPRTKPAPPPKASLPKEATPEARPLDCLMGDGPTYVLAVLNLTNFTLPIDSISPFQNLLHRYDKLEPGALPGDIRLEIDTDRWDFPPGAPMKVAGTKDEQFSASCPGLKCVFDYSGWLGPNKSPLTVEANFDQLPGAFSMHFGFSSPNDGDPFRLLIVSETKPPPPLHLARNLVQTNRQELGASLTGPVRDCVLNNFKLLGGRQWQLQPYLQTASSQAQYLYKGWTTNAPVFGCELDFARIAQRLQAQKQDLNNRLNNLSQPLGLQLGASLELTNANLENFLAFSRADLSRKKFLDYLKELKSASPTNSFIKNWHNSFDSDQPDEVSLKLQKLFELWTNKRPQDQPMLTVTNAGGLTNYFFSSWQSLAATESLQEQLSQTQKRLEQLGQVAYIGLFMVDQRKPGQGLEMIRFDEP